MRNDKPAKVPLLKDLKANRDLYLMMLPFFLLFFLMILLPVLVATVLSFSYYNMFENTLLHRAEELHQPLYPR